MSHRPADAEPQRTLEALRATLLADLELAMSLLRTMPPAISFFGGARIKADDPYYAISKAIGRTLAGVGIPPRTGAGPGIMQSVPEGFKEGLSQGLQVAGDAAPPVLAGFSEHARRGDLRTQGFNIVLPFEQGLNAAIDRAVAIQLFPYRKLALYENVRGVVTFPGGFGTLDELFEVWCLAARGKHADPLAVVGRDFWGPILDALHAVAVAGPRKLLSQADFELMYITDDPAELIAYLTAPERPVRGFETEPTELARAMEAELVAAIDTLASLPEAVTFIGGRRLQASDPACAAARRLAVELTGGGQALRVGGTGAVAAALVSGAEEGGAASPVQGFLTDDEVDSAPDGLVVYQRVRELITHKQLLGTNMAGLVALPGGLGTLDEVFTTLCGIQTGKVSERPVVLLGRSYWGPLFAALRASMLGPLRQTISPGDLERATITDDPGEALRALQGE